MGDEVEIVTQGVCDVENSIYVAVGENLKDGKSLLSWVLTNFPGKNICLLHVHRPSSSVSLRKFLPSSLVSIRLFKIETTANSV